MANHKSAAKRAKQSEKRYLRNKSYRTKLKNAIKQAKVAIETQKGEDSSLELKKTQKAIHNIKSKGIIHKKKAARLVSRLAKKANKKLKEISAS